ncbi:MAG: hypothetical protein ACJ768_08085 [Gaiellaceae bacterium]
MSDYPEIAERFARDTRDHRLTVLHDDGLHRHLRFSSNPRGYGEYWFDLITWPGRLAMCGDIGQDYVFSRLPDMFEFFRADRRWGINPHYWAEKLGGGRNSVKEYSEELLRQRVVEQFVEDAKWGGVPAGTGKHLRTWVLNEDLSDEHTARNVLEDFAFQGYEFKDVWEWDFQDYDSQFLWACHAIQWGIGRYDRVRKYGLKQLAEEKSSREPAADATPGEDYPGELDMLRGLVRTLRTVVRPDDTAVDVTEVRRLLHHHASDDAAARAEASS